MAKAKQLKLLKDSPKAYGGDLRNTRKGREGPRPLDTKNTIHLILKSRLAVGKWSFARKENRMNIERIVRKFSQKYGIRVFSTANVGNHLHFQLKITNRYTYEPFIKAITAAIAMAITGASRWNSLAKMEVKRFWDSRPFTRVVIGFRAFFSLRDYLEINQLEGLGCNRRKAKMIIADSKIRPWKYSTA